MRSTTDSRIRAGTPKEPRPTDPHAGDPDPTLGADTEALHRALGELLRAYQFRDRDRICCYDVSVTQCYALEALIQGGSLSLNELAAHLFLDKSTTSRVVDALERKGYLERRRNPADGRALLLEPTPAGIDLHGRIEDDILERERLLLAGFRPEVRRSMAMLIGELARAAAERIDTSGGTCCTVEPAESTVHEANLRSVGACCTAE